MDTWYSWALAGNAHEYPPSPYVELKIGPDTFKTCPRDPSAPATLAVSAPMC